MSKGQKLVNKVKRKERAVLEATVDATKANKRGPVLQASPAAQSLMRKPQRRMDRSFGYNSVPGDPILEFRVVAAFLERMDYGSSDFGLSLMLPGTAEIPGTTAEFSLAIPAANILSQAEYIAFADFDDSAVAAWFNIDSDDTAPTGAEYLAADVQVQVDILSTDNADQVATKLASALVTACPTLGFPRVNNLVSILYGNPGPRAVPASYVEDDSNVGSVTVTTVAPGSDPVPATSSMVSGALALDFVQILEGQAEGRMLEVVSLESDGSLRLDDVSTFAGTEADVAVRIMMSESKKSFK